MEKGIDDCQGSKIGCEIEVVGYFFNAWALCFILFPLDLPNFLSFKSL